MHRDHAFTAQAHRAVVLRCRLAAFATAHHDHMVLFVGPRGTLYVLDNPANRLYSAGDDLGELMHRLLLGYALGPEVSGGR